MQRGGVAVVPADDGNAAHRVGAPQQALAGAAVLGRRAQRPHHQRDRFGALLVLVTGQHLSAADEHGRIRVDCHEPG